MHFMPKIFMSGFSQAPDGSSGKDEFERRQNCVDWTAF
jgi:hypothetical protein